MVVTSLNLADFAHPEAREKRAKHMSHGSIDSESISYDDHFTWDGQRSFYNHSLAESHMQIQKLFRPGQSKSLLPPNYSDL